VAVLRLALLGNLYRRRDSRSLCFFVFRVRLRCLFVLFLLRLDLACDEFCILVRLVLGWKGSCKRVCACLVVGGFRGRILVRFVCSLEDFVVVSLCLYGVKV
jgi:hypothetical protein